jgi:hypothetical protein
MQLAVRVRLVIDAPSPRWGIDLSANGSRERSRRRSVTDAEVVTPSAVCAQGVILERADGLDLHGEP